MKSRARWRNRLHPFRSMRGRKDAATVLYLRGRPICTSRRADVFLIGPSVDVCESEEAWFVRKGGQRARCRLNKMLADDFDVNVTQIENVQAPHMRSVMITYRDRVMQACDKR